MIIVKNLGYMFRWADLETCCGVPGPDWVLVWLYIYQKLNDKDVDYEDFLQICEIFNRIKENGKLIEIADPDEKSFLEYVKNYCQKYNIVIDKDAIVELASRTDGDVALLQNSIEKLYF